MASTHPSSATERLAELFQRVAPPSAASFVSAFVTASPETRAGAARSLLAHWPETTDPTDEVGPGAASQTANADELVGALLHHTTWILDCDGVLWAGPEGIPGSGEAVLLLVELLGRRVLLLTNNANRVTPIFVSSLTKRLSLPTAWVATHFTDDNFWTAGHDVAHTLAKHLSGSGQAASDVTPTIYVSGRPGLQSRIREKLPKATLVSPPDRRPIPEVDPLTSSVWTDWRAFVETYKRAGPFDAVVTGFDPTLTYTSLTQTCLALQQTPRPLWVAANPDAGSRHLDGLLYPGTGSMTGFYSALLDRKPDLVCGKPRLSLFQNDCSHCPTRTVQDHHGRRSTDNRHPVCDQFRDF